jgi:FkbM family methyltransferase
LAETLRKNAPTASISIIHAAISYQGKSHVHFTSGRNTLTAHESWDAKVTDSLVPTITLSTLIQQERLSRYALICDIEGSEIDLIRNDTSALQHCDLVVLELHEIIRPGERISVETVLESWLAKSGMTLEQRYGRVCVLRR